MALYEAEFSLWPGTSYEKCMTQIFEAPKHSQTKRPATFEAYKYLHVLARDFGHDTGCGSVKVRVCLYWPPKFHYTPEMSRIGQTSEVDEFWVVVP